MPNNVINKIELNDNSIYTIEDSTALHFLGRTDTELSDGDNTNPIMINDTEVTVKQNDYVTANEYNQNFVFNGTVWVCTDPTSATTGVSTINVTPGQHLSVDNTTGDVVLSVDSEYSIPATTDQTSWSDKSAGIKSVTAESSVPSAIYDENHYTTITAGDNVSVIGNPNTGVVTISATDTTYVNEAPLQGGEEVSLVTTGDKYNWDHKLDGVICSNGTDDVTVTDTKLVAGTNITIQPDLANSTITINAVGNTYTSGTAIDITNEGVINNTGVSAVTASDPTTGTNGTVLVTTNGTTTEVPVKGLNTAAYKNVDIAITTSTTSDNVPTSAAVDTYVQKAISGVVGSMTFKGGVTIGSAGNIIVPSTITTIKEGYTFKVNTVTSGYTGDIRVGDSLIADKDDPVVSAGWVEDVDWTLVPTGHDEAGMVSSVTVNNVTYTPSAAGDLTLPDYPNVSDKIDTAGTGLSKLGTTLNHSNSITPQTTASAVKIKYDAQGHITGTGTLSAEDLSAVPTTRTINGKSLASNITLAATDLSAVPTTRTVNSKSLADNITLVGSDIKLTNYDKGTATTAITTSDTVNSAFAKHENRIDGFSGDTQATINMICKTPFSSTKQYEIGDIVVYKKVLYEFTARHKGSWTGTDVTVVDMADMLGNINTVLEALL